MVVKGVEPDPFAFTPNKCSPNARMVYTRSESIEFDIWFDKHYYIREQHGDDVGKRVGIDAVAYRSLLSMLQSTYYTIRSELHYFIL